MADEDEIDILGDFSFNSCFAQNNQGIPSCSNREDTVHPQWLLDSPPTNWYDTQNKDKSNRTKEGPSRKLSGNTALNRHATVHTIWTQKEKDLLKQQMTKHGRNIHKISQSLKTKTEAQIQALIEAEYGIHLENHPTEYAEPNNIPVVLQEEVMETMNMNDLLNMVTTGSHTIPVTKKPLKKLNNNKKIINSNVKPTNNIQPIISSEIFYEDDLIIGSTESIGSELDITDVVAKSLAKQQKEKLKTLKKNGNHRRKVSRNYDKNKTSKDTLKSPQRRKKDSSLSDDSVKSPKMQIILGSGLALPVSEGEEVIKIEKKEDLDGESDIEVDIDSESEISKIPLNSNASKKLITEEALVAIPLRKFEPLPKRNRKINLDGGGGYTIMHTESGDLYEIGQEPRKEKQQRKQPVHLIPLRVYNTEKPAPCSVHVHVSALVSMDTHAHCSRAEVMGLAGGRWEPEDTRLVLQLYRPAAAAAADTHCDMDPVSQARAAEALRARGAAVCGWHHSHPRFPPTPSLRDLRTQRTLQAMPWRLPCLALVTSQHWPPGRSASQLRCFRVEEDETDETTDTPAGYQLSVKLEPDLTVDNLQDYLGELRELLLDALEHNELSVVMAVDVCPQANLTYLEKCISSVSHHMRSAGYKDDDPIVAQLLQGIRDIFR